MGILLAEVIEAGGYDLSTIEDSIWLLSKQNEFEQLIESAEKLIEDTQEVED